MPITLDETTRAELKSYRLDEQQLAHFAELAKGSQSNAVKGVLTPPSEEDIVVLPKLGTEARRTADEAWPRGDRTRVRWVR